jgi:hypothetical protein
MKRFISMKDACTKYSWAALLQAAQRIAKGAVVERCRLARFQPVSINAEYLLRTKILLICRRGSLASLVEISNGNRPSSESWVALAGNEAKAQSGMVDSRSVFAIRTGRQANRQTDSIH